MTKREEYTAKAKAHLDELNAQMDVLAAKAKAARGDALLAYEAELAKMREQSKAAMVKCEALRLAGEERWDGAVKEMDKVRAALVDSFNLFKSRLK